jgi:hypothetical protein
MVIAEPGNNLRIVVASLFAGGDIPNLKAGEFELRLKRGSPALASLTLSYPPRAYRGPGCIGTDSDLIRDAIASSASGPCWCAFLRGNGSAPKGLGSPVGAPWSGRPDRQPPQSGPQRDNPNAKEQCRHPASRRLPQRGDGGVGGLMAASGRGPSGPVKFLNQWSSCSLSVYSRGVARRGVGRRGRTD